MSDVEFKEGTEKQFNNLTPDENIFYKISDTKDVYLGEVKLSNEADLQAILVQLEDLQNRVYDLENPFYLFAGYTCQQVLDIIDAGQAANYWSVGDVTEPIKLNGVVSTYTFENESYCAMLIGLDHNMDLETRGKHNAVFQFGQNEDGVNIAFGDPNYDGGTSSSKTGFRMNDSSTNVGGWESCWMRNQIMEEFFEALPTDLQKIIGTTTKYTDNVGNASGSVESNVTATEDKIFLPASLEIFSSDSYVNSYEADYQERYAWYAENDSSNARIRYKHFNPSSTSVWWLRSPYRTISDYFRVVATYGGDNYYYANSSYGFAPAFTVIGGA